MDTDHLPEHCSKQCKKTHVVDTILQYTTLRPGQAFVSIGEPDVASTMSDGSQISILPGGRDEDNHLSLPAESDVDGHFIDFSLVRQAVVTRVRQEDQSFVIGKHGIVETRSTTLQPDKRLPYTVAGGGR